MVVDRRIETSAVLLRLLSEAVVATVGRDVHVALEADVTSDWLVRARMVSRDRDARRVHISTGGELFHISFPDLDRGSVLIDYDFDEPFMSAMCFVLARAARAYLDGAGTVSHERGLLGRRTILTLPTPDGEWRFGPRWSTAHYPD